MSFSLRIGSTDLGWTELGAVAVPAHMTRAMPGGDGSFEFTIGPDAAEEARNAVVEGAELHYADGGVRWDGFVVNDPFGARWRIHDAVHVEAAGMWSRAADRRDIAWTFVDSDPTQWFRIRQKWDSDDPDYWVNFVDQGKFTTDTEGRLYLRGDSDRTYTGYARCSLAYWLNGGVVDLGNRIYGVKLVYESNYPTDWRMTVRSGDSTPWVCAEDGTIEESDTTDRSSWRTLQVNTTAAATALQVNLNFNTVASGSPATDPWIKVKSVSVQCRGSVGSPDTSVTLDEAMGDLATLTGLATVTRTATIGDAQPHLALRPDTSRSVADALRELAAMHTDFIEQYFDCADGAWRYTANVVPVAVNATRNRHWVLSDSRPGESSAGVVRDYEAAPAYVRVLYLASGVTGVADGNLRSYCYPSEPTLATDRVHVYDGLAEMSMTSAQAALVAQRVWTQMQSGGFVGPAVFGPTAMTTTGQELPSALMRPGDRVTISDRLGASDLYVAETSHDFGSQNTTATLGWPFDLIANVPQMHRPTRPGTKYGSA
jgi:hypothetical protein